MTVRNLQLLTWQIICWVALASTLIVAVAVGLATQDKPAFSPKPVAMAPVDRQAVTDAYRVLVDANKDFQIVLLKARINSKVDETWGVDLQAMTFTPPLPEKPKP